MKPMRVLIYMRYLPLVCLLLAACSVTPPAPFISSPITAAWKDHQQAVQQLTQYQASGSLAYFSEHKKSYARFFWQQDTTQKYRLLLTNPLGGTELDLRVEPGFIQVIDSKGQRHVSNDLDSTIKILSGMTIPMENLRLWLLGLPGASKQFQLNTDNQLKQLLFNEEQQNWHVIYQNYHNQYRIALPKQIDLFQGESRIKLKIDQWTLP